MPTNKRLETFMKEYQKKMGNEYVVGDYRKEGGAAKHTEGKVEDDEVYRDAVKIFLDTKDDYISDNCHSYMLFIGSLNKWVQKSLKGLNNGSARGSGWEEPLF